jgi:hypothetical protein
MVRVPLGFRGVAVLLLAASTVAGQTPEPPDELLLEPFQPRSTDFLRQYSAESHNPLLNLVVEGQLTALDAAPAPPKDSSRLTPTPQQDSAKPKLTEVPPGAIEIDDPGACTGMPNAGPEACSGMPNAGPEACSGMPTDCPEAPNCLPFAGPPPCCTSKCKHRSRHQRCASCSPCDGNPYLGWPCDMGGCQGGRCHKCRRNRCCGWDGPSCGYACGGGCSGGYGGCFGGYGGFADSGCTPYIAPAPPPCFCHKCQRKHGCGHQGCNQAWCGGPGYGWGCDGGFDGGWDGGFGCGGFSCAPPSCPCRRCQRKHGCSSGYGYAGCGCPCWPAYPVPGWNMDDGGSSCCGCRRFGGCGCWTHFPRCHCRHVPPYPSCAYPGGMSGMAAAEPFCADCGLEGDFGAAAMLSGSEN